MSYEGNKSTMSFGSTSFSHIIPAGSRGLVLERKEGLNPKMPDEVETSRVMETVEIWTAPKYKKVYLYNEDGSPKMIPTCGFVGKEEDLPAGAKIVAKVGSDPECYRWERLDIHACQMEEDVPSKKTGIVMKHWLNHHNTVIKCVIKKNGKEVYNDAGWFKR